MSHQFGAIVLAAGLSSRMGEFKLLLPWVNNQPIIGHIVGKLVTMPLATIVVVTGHHATEVRQTLDSFEVTIAYNPNYATGEILSSLKVGLAALPESINAALVVPGDLPRIPISIMAQVLDAYRPGSIIAPRFESQRGHPVLIDRRFWADIIALPSDSAPRDVLRHNQDHTHLVDVASDSILRDIDTVEDYQTEYRRAQNRDEL